MEQLPVNGNIMLIGFMGAGKSAVAGRLRDCYGFPVVEMDERIVEIEGMSISQIFETRGEAYFRDCETRLLKELAGLNGLVVSCGGGAALKPENVKLMKQNGVVALLAASPETVYRRIRDSQDRPVLKGHMTVEYIEALQAKRREPYLAAADFIIDTNEKTVEQVCAELLEQAAAWSRKKER